jgi:serine protease Do
VGKVRRGYLGINLDSVKAEFARVYGLAEAKGVIVTDVREPQGPAGKAGIQPLDIIVEFNGQQVANAQDLINKVASTQVGQTVPVTLLRDMNGKMERRTVNVTVGERPSSLAPSDPYTPSTPKGKEGAPIGNLKLGITLAEMTTQAAEERNLKGVRGLLVKDVDPNGIAADARPIPVKEGDVIVRINRVPVSTLADFQRVISGLKPGDAIVLNVANYSKELDRVVQRIVQFTYQ